MKCLETRKQAAVDFESDGNVHCRRKRVVRTLAHVDVIVRMNGRLAAKRSAEHFNSAIAEDFVDVHVRLGARTRLPYHKWKVIVEFTGNNL